MTLEEAKQAYLAARAADTGTHTTTREREKAALELAEAFIASLRKKPPS